MIEARLDAAAPDEQEAAAVELEGILGFPVQLLDRDEIAAHTDDVDSIETLVDEEGQQSFLLDMPRLRRVVLLGPVPTGGESLVLNLVPPVFYLSIFVIVGLWLRPLLKDLNVITTGAERFAADYREPLATADDTTQLTELATHLDDMSERISGLIQSQKELIAALSHEMRTPLARIRFALAVIENEGDGADPSFRGRLEGLAGDVQEIDRLIATMLEYARLDHPDLRMNWQRVPIDAWLRDTADKIHHPSVSLAVARHGGIETAEMDPRLMGLALSNLLSNASRHAAAQVCCSLTADDAYRIEVHDDGHGIPETERDLVFKAFTRLDDSRNRETGGYGLGLAIVARIANLHGGAAQVDRSPDLGGARFVISWPGRTGRAHAR